MAKNKKHRYKDIKEGIAKANHDIDYEAPLYERDKKGTLKINHKEAAHTMVAVVRLTPMHPLLKRVLSLRLLGTEPLFIPLTQLQVAITLGMKEDKVIEAEKEGKHLVSQYMKQVSIDDTLNKYSQNSKDEKDLRNDLSNPN